MVHDIKTSRHLLHLIKNRNDNVPTFSLLVGSGASVTSGVNTAESMIESWRHEMFERSGKPTLLDWLERQTWYGDDDEYSILFEMLYDQPSQRRIHIEECIKGAKPGWGYVYLTNLLANNYFDVVFTTNFDDLINEACYLYSEDLRPLVAAHDSSIQNVRVTSRRPKIIKLHGDFLYDNIKNTTAELASLEVNMNKKFAQFAQEYGLVVIGYSGRDQSVMDTIDKLLEDENNYREGIYWCDLRNQELSSRLERLLERDRVYLVEIEGFDEFLAELHSGLKLPLAKAVARPFDVALDRANLLLPSEQPRWVANPIIESHIAEVFKNFADPTPTVPRIIQAASLSRRGETMGAVQAWREAYQEDPKNGEIAAGYERALAQAGLNDELATYAMESDHDLTHKIYLLLLAGHNQSVVEEATKALSDTPEDFFDWYDSVLNRINRAIALKRIGNIDSLKADLNHLRNVDVEHSKVDGDGHELFFLAGIAALEGKKEEMLAAVRKAMDKDLLTPRNLMEFPVFEDYRDDEDFKCLIAAPPVHNS